MELFDELCGKCAKAELCQFSVVNDGSVVDMGQLKEEISTLLMQVLSADHLIGLWKGIIMPHKIGDDSSEDGWRRGDGKRKVDVYRLLSGHRVISNYHMFLGETLGSARDHKKDGEPDGGFSKEQYHRKILSAFTKVVSGHDRDAGFVAASNAVFEWFPADTVAALLELLCEAEAASAADNNTDMQSSSTAAFAAALSAKWLHELCRQLLRLGKQFNRVHPSRKPGLMSLLRCLLARYFTFDDDDNDDDDDDDDDDTHSDNSTALASRAHSLSEELLLKRPADEPIACLVMEMLPMQHDCLLRTMHAVAALWAERLFVRRADQAMQSYLSHSLLSGLNRLSSAAVAEGSSSNSSSEDKAAFLYRTGPRGVPLLVTLSQGVSAYLDCAESVCRLNGMKVACCFSAITGHALSFPELEQEKQRVHKQQQHQERTAKLGSSQNQGANKGGSGGKKGIRSGFLLSRSDPDPDDQVTQQGGKKDEEKEEQEENGEEFEFEAYDLGEEPEVADPEHYTSREQRERDGGLDWSAELGVYSGRTNYLYSCLLMLRVDHAKPEACEKHRVALSNLPRILENSPQDGPILAPPLLTELLKMSNHFNEDDFDALKGRAVLAVLSTYPTEAIPVAAACAESAQFALGARLYALKALGQVSYTLAGLEPPSSQSESDSSQSNSKQQVWQQQGLFEMTSYPSSPAALGKTIVKRPRKLALQKQQQSCPTRNRFGSTSPLLVTPLLRLLGKHATGQQWGGRGTLEELDGGSSASGAFRLQKADAEVLLLPTQQQRVKSAPGISLLGDDNGNDDDDDGAGSISSSNNPASGISRNGSNNIDDDSAEHLLIADTLFTLGTAVRCGHNTAPFRLHLEAVLPAAISPALRTHSSLQVRRASLVAAYLCIDSWSMQRRQSQLNRSSPGFISTVGGGKGGGAGGGGRVIGSARRAGALDTLRNLVGSTLSPEDALLGTGSADGSSTGGGGSGGAPFQTDPALGQVVADYVDWCLGGLREEADDVCRALRAETVRAAISLDADLPEFDMP
jgi:hypothetical protein